MDKIQKEKIIKLRNEGKSYTVIADELKISRDTVKSFCRRNIAVERPQGNSVWSCNCSKGQNKEKSILFKGMQRKMVAQKRRKDKQKSCIHI